ncbi:hypothetical protein HWV62_9077 [Athelia sp. TMB]|nr:hypothetical protein HWV62_9077 [Athelia sp. TMB]
MDITRARGAEPIYLHVIRPMIKPYASTVDSLLDLARMFGDIAFIVITVPFQHALSWWTGVPLDAEEPQDIQQIHDIDSELPVTSTRSLKPATPVTLVESAALVLDIHEPSREPSPVAVRNPSPVPIRHPSPVPVRNPSPVPVRRPSPVPVRNPSPLPVLPVEREESLAETLGEPHVDEPSPITRTNSTAPGVGEIPPVSPSEDKGDAQVALTAPAASTRTLSSTSQTSSGGAPSIASSTSVNSSLLPRPPRKDDNKRRTRRKDDAKAPTGPPKPHEPQVYRYQTSPKPKTKAVPTQPVHEIWLPPVSAAREGSGAEAPPTASEDASGQSRVNTSRSGPDPEVAETLTVDEWRLYPPFPSAYPPTPLPAAPVKLISAPSNFPHSAPRRPTVQTRSLTDGRQPSSSRILDVHPEAPKPNDNSNLSDDDLSTTGRTGGEDSSDDGEGMDVDSVDDSDDDFNVTLQTPLHQRNATYPVPRNQLRMMASDSSMASSIGKLSTVDRGSAIYTDESSDSDSGSITDESSVVGHKRSATIQGGRDAQGTIKASSRQIPQAIQLPRQASSTSASESLDDKAVFDNSSDTKRRRVTAPARKPTDAPTRASTNDATVRGRTRGRGQPPTGPTRASTRLATVQAPGLAAAHSNSSQTTIGGGRLGRGAAVTRERTVRGRA